TVLRVMTVLVRRCTMHAMDQGEVDARIQAYYTEHFVEAERLTVRSAQGRLELERTQELVCARIPARARVLDIGGATGVHAAPLAALGHDVVLIDPVAAQVAEAARAGTFQTAVGDARCLEFGDDTFDAALLLGPLYHLAERRDRLTALREAGRVVRAGGWVFAAAIPRLARLTALTSGEAATQHDPAQWIALLEHGTPPEGSRFPGAHFHTAEELERELTDAGLAHVDVCAVEGPDGFGLEQVTRVDEDLHEAALRVVRGLGHLPGVRDLSPHILGIARVP
ncbi:MAG: class I SAM-dependent methyltransferase, partial [Herbiconiux sp.]|nr:class I SAM-dependent methyltransferase [Herbiconiux sp.]